MYTCGVDIGSRSTKAIILNEDAVRGRGLQLTGGRPSKAAEEAIEEALLAARITKDEIAATAATGYGRRLTGKHDLQFTSVTCHARGAYHAFPGTRNVLDVGALRSTAIRLDKNGRVHRFRLNDRCGAGIGRFLERVADTLEIPLEEIGQLALFSRDPQPVPSICTVLAETEVLNLITHEKKPADILRGVYDALAEKLAELLKQVWIPDAETTLTGGVAKNTGMVVALEEVLGMSINIDHDAEFMGAIGAALIAQDTVKGKAISEISA
jgi:predicted CoA-substrate-specific enzyme activase